MRPWSCGDGRHHIRFTTSPARTPLSVVNAPNRTYTGQVAISTAAKSGTLQLTDASGLFGPGAHGWEWSY